MNGLPSLNTLILVFFLVAWLYTEITEYSERERWRRESVKELDDFKAFLLEGERFTLLDGMNLSARVSRLEEAAKEQE